jgi:hypothetical protein
MVVVDLEDGARLMVQGSPADAEELAVGDPVTLVLRRYALEGGVPVYGYKAFRSAGADQPDGAGTDTGTGTVAIGSDSVAAQEGGR